MEIKSSILETVGNTPIVRINRLFSKPGVELLAKLEGFNPMGSVKDRIAVAMVEGAEREGLLTPDKILVESSSGNTGIGLAMVAAVKGYRVLITMPQKVSIERRKMMRSLGAELILVDGGSDEAWDLADRIAASDPKKYFRVHQYKSKYNVLAHYLATGPEIWRQTGGRVTHVIIPLGTTGTIVGAGKYLKEQNPAIRVIAVEPVPVNTQQGLRNLQVQRVPEIFDPSVIDETIQTQDQEAYGLARELATREGIFAGISSGSCMAGAIRVAERLERGVIVAVLPDRGEKYLSTPLFDRRGDPQVWDGETSGH